MFFLHFCAAWIYKDEFGKNVFRFVRFTWQKRKVKRLVTWLDVFFAESPLLPPAIIKSPFKCIYHSFTWLKERALSKAPPLFIVISSHLFWIVPPFSLFFVGFYNNRCSWIFWLRGIFTLRKKVFTIPFP